MGTFGSTRCLVQQVDGIDLHRLSDPANGLLMCSGAIHTAASADYRRHLDRSQTGGDRHFTANGASASAYEFFIGIRAVDFRRCQESDAAFEGGMDRWSFLSCL